VYLVNRKSYSRSDVMFDEYTSWRTIEEKFVIEAFDEIAEGYQHWRSRPWSRIKNLALRVFRRDPILDAGCGNGRHSIFLLENGREVVALDISISMLKKYRNAAKRRLLTSRLNPVQGSVVLMPFRANAFNGILCIAVLHNIPGSLRRLEALREIKRLLKPNAVAILTVWSLLQPRMMLKALKCKLFHSNICRDFGDVLIPWRKRGKTILRFYHLFTSGEIRNIVNKVGFSINLIEVFGREYLVFPRNFLLVLSP